MPYNAPPNLSDLSPEAISDLLQNRKLPPIASWDPPSMGDSKICIQANGDWVHDGGIIRRKSMVRAFASIMRRDKDGSYWLVTPYEKQYVTVADAPLIAVEVQHHGKGETSQLSFRLNSDDILQAGPENKLHFHDLNTDPRPYIYVRNGFDARLSRAVFLELVEIALTYEEHAPAIWSNGSLFVLKNESISFNGASPL